ncbi:MAG: hypothetical protein JWN73_2329 [Betaproteobacteria bacterium]|nr:hypothetical protein [Betaproteobacteria bacterium]
MWPNAQILVRQTLLKSGLHVSSTTHEARLADFFSTIKPVVTDHPLLRLGGETDGGYLIPDDLSGIGACFSPGVANSSNFELAMAGRGIPCFMADFSVDGPAAEHPLFRFDKKFLGPDDAGAHMRLETWVNQYAAGASDLLLQMDIEGSEYGVILDTPVEVLRRFRIMAIEFHHMHALVGKFGFDLIHLTFKKLLKEFDVVHLHPNNCAMPVRLGPYAIPPVLEVTLLRRDRIASRAPASLFPHPLDRSSYAHRGDYALPECWFR